MKVFWGLLELLVHFTFMLVYIGVTLVATEAGSLWVAAVFGAAAYYAGHYAFRHLDEQLTKSIQELN
jgi:hypothetical protein